MNNTRRNSRVRVRINRLQLHGFDQRQSQKIKLELETILSGLIRSGGLSADRAHGRVGRSVGSKPIQVQSGADGEGIGRQIAEHIYEGLKR